MSPEPPERENPIGTRLETGYAIESNRKACYGPFAVGYGAVAGFCPGITLEERWVFREDSYDNFINGAVFNAGEIEVVSERIGRIKHLLPDSSAYG
jgi:hypothetical protein